LEKRERRAKIVFDEDTINQGADNEQDSN
jgi:hypothetical protein